MKKLFTSLLLFAALANPAFADLQVGQKLRTQSITASYTVTNFDDVISANAITSNITVTLPNAAAAALNGKVLLVKKIDSSSNTVTLTPQGGQTIDGLSSVIMGSKNDSIRIQAVSSNWIVLDWNVSVGASYGYAAGALYVSANTVSILPYDTKFYDTQGNFSTSTYTFNCYYGGKYLVAGKLTAAVSNTSAQQQLLYLYHNGTQFVELGQTPGNGTTTNARTEGTTTIQCATGENLTLYGEEQGSGVSSAGLAGAVTLNWFNIQRIGN